MKINILLITFAISSSLVKGQSVLNFRRSPGGAISPGRHGRPTMSFNKNPASVNFYQSRELIGREMHSNVNSYRMMNRNSFNNNQGHFNGRGSFNNFGTSNNIGAYKNFGTDNGNGYNTNLGTTKRNIGSGYNNNYDISAPNLPNEYGSNGFGVTNGFSSSNIFGSIGLPNGIDSYNGIGLGGYASSGMQLEKGLSSSYDQQPIIQKNIYVHVPPPELEDSGYPSQQPLPVAKPEKQYKIIFIKAPSPPKPPQTIIPAQPLREEKTLVYVLVKKPEEPSRPIVPLPEPTKPSKPEVFFIRYKTSKDSGGYPETSQNPGTTYGVPGYGSSGHSLYGQGSNLKPMYLPANQYQIMNNKSY